MMCVQEQGFKCRLGNEFQTKVVGEIEFWRVFFFLHGNLRGSSLVSESVD